MFENERFEAFLFTDLDFKYLYRRIFVSTMVIKGYRLGYLILIVYMMMNPFNRFLLIPLSLIPLMGLLSSSLP